MPEENPISESDRLKAARRLAGEQREKEYYAQKEADKHAKDAEMAAREKEHYALKYPGGLNQELSRLGLKYGKKPATGTTLPIEETPQDPKFKLGEELRSLGPKGEINPKLPGPRLKP